MIAAAAVVVAADFKFVVVFAVVVAVVFVVAFKFVVADFKFVVDADDRAMRVIRNTIEQRNFILTARCRFLCRPIENFELMVTERNSIDRCVNSRSPETVECPHPFGAGSIALLEIPSR